MIAVLFYLSGTIPLLGLTLVELGIIGTDAANSLKWPARMPDLPGDYHVAMIFGMLDPTLLGYRMAHQH